MSAPTLTFSPAMFHAAYVARIKSVTRRFLAGSNLVNINKLIKDLRVETSTVRGKQRLRAVVTHLRSGVTVDLRPPAHLPGETKPMVTSWAVHSDWDDDKPSQLEADVIQGEIAAQYSGGIWFNDGSKKPCWAGKLRPARFLPKFLYHLAPQVRIESARPEALHYMTEADALAEGIYKVRHDANGLDVGFTWSPVENSFNTAVEAYFHLWNTIHPDHPAHTNPIVWRYEFTVL